MSRTISKPSAANAISGITGERAPKQNCDGMRSLMNCAPLVPSIFVNQGSTIEGIISIRRLTVASSATELTIEISEKTEKINELRDLDERTDEQTGELDKLSKRVRVARIEQRAALVVDGEKVETRAHETHDAEHQERLELRSKARLGRYISRCASRAAYRTE